MTTTVAEKAEPEWQPSLSARDVVEQRLEPGEPIEAFLRLAATGPAPDSRSGGVLTAAGALTLSGPAVRHMIRSTTIAVTDRRVFFVRTPTPQGVRVEPKKAVRVLSYDTTGRLDPPVAQRRRAAIGIRHRTDAPSGDRRPRPLAGRSASCGRAIDKTRLPEGARDRRELASE